MDISEEQTSADIDAGKNSGREPTDDFIYSRSELPRFSAGQPDELNIPVQFIESLPFPLFIKDLNGVYLACNRHFCNMVGFSSDQIIGNNISTLFDPESAKIHLTADKQLIQSGIRVVYETSLSGPEIKYGLVRVIKSPLSDKQGKLYGIIGLISEINSGDGRSDQFDAANSDIDAFFRMISDGHEENENLFSAVNSNQNSTDNGFLQFETRFDVILKALNAGIWEWDPHIDKLYWSEKCFDIFGMETGLEKPELWMSRIHPEDFSRVREMWSRITLQSGWFDLEFRILVEGQPRWVKKTGYCMRSKNAGSDKVTGVMADVSDEKDFNEKLFNNQHFFKAIIEDQSELICRIIPGGSITFVNRAFTKFFGIPAETFNKHLLAGVFPEKDYLKIRKLLNSIKPPKHFVKYEQRILRNDGNPSIVHWTIRAIYGKNDTPEEYQFVGRDVTEIEESREALKRSEEMFRLIAENSNDIISIHPENGVIDYVSPSVKHILGYNADELTGTLGNDLVYEEDLDILKSCSISLRKSIDPVLISFRLKERSGSLIWFESMVQRQYNNKGEATGKVIAVSRNIQSRKLVEEQQKLTEKQLKEANLTKDKFFSIIAHDLRSPFTSILGFTRLLDEEYDDFTDEERKTMVKQIQNSTESTFQLLDNLLAWAKTQLGRTIFTPESFTLESLIFETIKQTTPQAEIKNIKISYGKIVDLILYADQNMLRTVIRNLLSNAVKFSFPGGIVELETVIAENNLTISVTDHGTGIPPEALDNLFSLTENVVSTKGTANEKGTGLGLILCREFIERNGGSIHAKSKVGKGSTFSIVLPVKPVPETNNMN
ncbi:MAG: PAS domain S-box protein [Bacteroidales bacterium]|nr:PAS domain S-box protein [Bacteroidales bacterium]